MWAQTKSFGKKLVPKHFCTTRHAIKRTDNKCFLNLCLNLIWPRLCHLRWRYRFFGFYALWPKVWGCLTFKHDENPRDVAQDNREPTMRWLLPCTCKALSEVGRKISVYLLLVTRVHAEHVCTRKQVLSLKFKNEKESWVKTKRFLSGCHSTPLSGFISRGGVFFVAVFCSE